MKALRLLCILGGLLSSSFALDREAFTFTRYDLDVRIEPGQQRLGVRGKITLRNDSPAPLKNLPLQISSSLDWRSIQLNGKPVQFVSQPYVSDIDHTGALSEAIVSLPREVPPKATVELEIGYEGTITLDATRLTRFTVPDETAKHSDWDQIGGTFSAVRGVGYVAWYPSATDAATLTAGNNLFETVGRWKGKESAAEMKLRVSVVTDDGSPLPEIFVNAPNCRTVSEAVGRAQQTSSECVFEPLGARTPMFVLANYSLLDRPQISLHYFPDHKAAAGSYATAAEKVVPFVTDWFGAPREKANVFDLPDRMAAPYESGGALLTRLNPIESNQAEIVAVHQLTHASLNSPRSWIYEGLAHFAQAVYREQQSGREAALDLLAQRLSAITGAEEETAVQQLPNAAADESLINTFAEEFFRSKAAYVWWMLRDMVGEPALKKALAAYRPEQDQSPAYVQQLIQAQVHRNLEWFFDDWVYRDRGLPDFHVESVYPRMLVKGGYLVTVTIEDLGNAGAEVPVTLRYDGGAMMKRLEVHGKSKNSIRFDVPSLPREVVLNDGSVPESDMANNTFKVEAPAN